jgi:hypothetical protein
MSEHDRLKAIEESLLTMHAGLTESMVQIASHLERLCELVSEAADVVIRIGQPLIEDQDPYNLFGDTEDD